MTPILRLKVVEKGLVLIQNIIEYRLEHIVMTCLTLTLPVAVKEVCYDS
jgi:hypothetical protein